ncbi:MAG: Cys-tRNA(Pro) deacylase [Lachnospiraceae bacterium]|nr:Cys-tRNA(Pro) deacylase [Lachnospiraceae bacterium]
MGKSSKTEKTNVMRVLDSQKISYESFTYEADPTLTGEEIANILGEEPCKVFKTLVTQSKSNNYLVFVVPVNEELDLKKAAWAAHEKAVSMIKQKDLLTVTGYVHGGCSPIGMKKLFPTYIHETAKNYDKMYVSAGKVGCQICVEPEKLIEASKAVLADLCV